MKITSKQRAYLRKEAHHLDSILHIGKGGISPEIIQSIDEALEKRELIKVNVLKNCFEEPKELGQVASERTHAVLVQVVGRCITLYRPSKDKPIIELP